MHDRVVRPVGYCAAYVAMDEAKCAELGIPFNQLYFERHEHTRSKHHGDGHPSKEEACACYRGYLLDHHLRFDLAGPPDEQHKCEAPGCSAWTQKTAALDYVHWWLCDGHRNRDTVEVLFGPIHEIWSS